MLTFSIKPFVLTGNMVKPRLESLSCAAEILAARNFHAARQRAMWTRQDAKGAHVGQFSRALFTTTAIVQIYFQSVINWPITAPTSFIIHNVNMICDDSYQLPQDALGHSAVFRYSISRRTSIIKAKKLNSVFPEKVTLWSWNSSCLR